MQTVKIYHAQCNLPSACTIEISEQLPDLRNSEHKEWLKESDDRFNEQAEMLLEALIEHLPGGTLDRLTAKLLAYKSTHFVISHATYD